MELEFTEIIDGTHDLRQVEVDRRHDAGVFNAHLRRRRAVDMAAEHTIPDGEGVLKLSAADFDEVPQVVEQSTALLAQSGEVTARKVGLLSLEAHQDPTIVDSPLFRLALNPKLVAIVSDYLGFVPMLATADVWYNPNRLITDGHQQGYPASRFHLDWADNRIVKVFVHCTDVTDANGAVRVIDPIGSEHIRNSMEYTYTQRKDSGSSLTSNDGLFVGDALIDAHIGDEARQRVLTGPTGTVYLVDTARCFHFGGRNTQAGQPRMIGILLFLRPGALKLTKTHGDVPPFAHLATPEMTVLQRLVLGADVTED
jgi:hypothetical protein